MSSTPVGARFRGELLPQGPAAVGARCRGGRMDGMNSVGPGPLTGP